MLLLHRDSLVKTRSFINPVYIGDVINTVIMFDSYFADEIVLFDITGLPSTRSPNYALLSKLSSYCRTPLTYGGGLRSFYDVQRVFQCGFERVVLNHALHESLDLLESTASCYGSQSVSCSIDYYIDEKGNYFITYDGGLSRQRLDIVQYSKTLQDHGAGEILLTNIENEGNWCGYDVETSRLVSASVSIPVVVNGGCSSLDDFICAATTGKANAVAASSIFLYQANNNGVLINYPSEWKSYLSILDE